MFTHLRSALCTAALLLSPAFARAQVYLPASAPPVPGSAQANTSQVYHYFNGVPYYQGFYYPGPQGYYEPLGTVYRTALGFDIPSLIVIAPPVTTTASGPVATSVAAPARTETATLNVRLPAQAELYIQDKKMGQTGVNRTFVTPPLAEGQTYLYRIKAVWSDNGYKREVKRTVIVAAGDHASLTILGMADEK